ncbi:MAG: hypothetical protein AMS23_08890, partial [Bacteroides sp. SM1_62]
TSFTCADVGANTVTMTVTDVAGLTDVSSSTVTVLDVTPPIAVCQNITVQLDATGNATIIGADVDNGSSDNCGIVSMLVSPNAFDCTNVGPNTVTLTVIDASGNSNTCTSIVTVEDNIAPNAVCQDITIQLNAAGNAAITGADIDNGSTDACGIQSLTASPNIFTCSEVGPNSVTLTVTDVNGNVNTCTAIVTVQDITPPNAVCQAITVQLDASGNAIITGADIDNGSSDACGIASLVTNPSNFDCTDVGPNTVTLTVTDNSGISSSCNTIVTVEDNIPPTAVCQDVTIQLNAAGNASLLASDIDNGSFDACGIQSMTVSPNTFTCANVGPNAVTLTVTDVNGNINACGAIVTVQDITPPAAICQDITVQLDATGNATITGTDIDGGSNDACGIAAMTANPNIFDCTDVGNNIVTLTVTDVNGNSNTCTANVLVEDNISPTALCQNITVQLDGTGNATITGTDIDGGSSDACGIASLVAVPNTFTCTEVGPNNVTLTVTDNNGNINTCIAVVTVEETVPPTISCPNDTSLTASAGSCSTVVNNIAPVASDNCGISNITYRLTGSTLGSGTDDASGTTFNKGNTTVWYKVTDGSGNADSCSFDVNVFTIVIPPDSAYADNDSICPGIGNIQLMYGGGVMVEGGQAIWYDDASMTSRIGTGNDLSVTAPLNETTYFVRFEGDCDTSSAASTTVYIYPEPAPAFDEMAENACISGPLYKYSVTGLAGSTFTWSISGGSIVSDYGDSVLVDWGSVAGTFHIAVTEITINGCLSDSVSLDVTVGGPTVDLGEGRIICEGESVTIIPTGNYSYQQWHDLSTGDSYTADTTEMVSITVYDAFGCMAEDSVQVTSHPTPVVDLGNDTTLCGQMSLILDAGNPGAAYLWSTGDVTQTIEVFAGEQFITVEVINPGGCTGEGEIHIQPCSPRDFFANIPNTITPNSDNVNDTWQIDEALAYPDIEIEIFDRWGKLVWRSSRGYSENWDGRNMNGRELPMDSYFYVINLNDGSEPINGTVTIIR